MMSSTTTGQNRLPMTCGSIKGNSINLKTLLFKIVLKHNKLIFYGIFHIIVFCHKLRCNYTISRRYNKIQFSEIFRLKL